MPLQFRKSMKGRNQLLYQGYLHTKERVFGNKTFWKCASYHKYHCPGRAHTCGDHVIKYTAHHHPPIKTVRKAKINSLSTKATAPSSPQLTHRVVPSTSSALPEIVPTKKPRMQYSAHDHPPSKASKEAKRVEQTTKTTTPSSPQLTHRVVPSTSSALPEIVSAKKPCMQYSAHDHPPSKASKKTKRIEQTTKTTTPSCPQLTHKVLPSTSSALPEIVPAKKPCMQYSAHDHPPSKASKKTKRAEQTTKTTTPSCPQLTHKVLPSTSSALPEIVPAKKPCIQNVKQAIQRLRACLNAARQPSQPSSSVVAKSIPEDPSVPSVIPPDLHECPERIKDGGFMASPILNEVSEASHSVHLQASQEAKRQRFRSGTVPPGASPQEILSWVSEAAQQWLCPQKHDKDQIVDMVILEQFLAVLPVSMQAWVKAREPRSSEEAVRLAETYLRDEELATDGQELEKDQVTFEDVSLHFSEEEWVLLDQADKALYWDIIHQNYDNVAWLNGSKWEKDPWQEAPEPRVECLKKTSKEIPGGIEQDSVRESNLERQPKNSSAEKEDASFFISGWNEITRHAELGLETVCMCWDCRKQEESSSIAASRKSHTEEDAKPVILAGELQESSERKIPQNLEENLSKEGQKEVEKHQSNNSRVEDSRLVPETLCMAVDDGDQGEFLTLLHDQIITIEDDLECVALPEGSLLILEKDISQNPGEDSQHEPIHVYSLSELNRTYSQEGVNGIAALISQKTTIPEQISSPEKEGGEANGLPELTEDLLLLHSQSVPEPQTAGPNAEESSEHNSHQKRSQGEDLAEGPNDKGQFIQSSASTTQPTCSDSVGNSSSLSVLLKHRRHDKKRKPCSGRNMPVRSALETQRRIYPGGKLHKHLNLKNWWATRKWGCRFPELQVGLRKHGSVNSNAQPHETVQPAKEAHRTTSEATSSSDTREVKPWQRAPSSSLLDKMAAEPMVEQLMAVLKQVAADTAEIKSAVSRLHPTVASIQHALGNLSGCTDDAEHRILDLEFTSQNTKAQLVQQRNEMKAIEAKLVGKAVQTNAIAELWPSLGIKREMSP